MLIHRTGGLWVAVLALMGGAIVGSAAAERVVFARYLALSPDGKTLAFAWAGDVWTVPSSGGTARRLTINPARDGYPVWSPDGTLLAFASDRHGAPNVFVMTCEGGDIRRVTFSDNAEIPTAFTPDGQHIYFHARKRGEPGWEPRMYCVATAGGQSWRVSEAGGSFARPSPDGRQLAFTRGVSPWWRTGYRGSANWDVWLHDLETGEFTQLTDFDGTDMHPCWDARGTGVYFLSDREDTHNVWYQPVRGGRGSGGERGGPARRITNVTGDRVRDFTVSADGRRLAYTQWDKIFVASLPRGAAQEIEVTAASDTARNAIELKTQTGGASEAEASPDGKEVALVARGEIFVIKTEPDRPTRRVTGSAARDWHVTWSPDGKALYFVSDREGQEDIYRATSGDDPPQALSDSLRFRIERVTDNAETELAPQVSPDGDRLSFVRGRGNLCVRDLSSGAERVLLEGWNPPNVRWSPDGKWIAYAVEDEEYNPDVWIVPADGSAAAVNISRHPDRDGNPQWSADGQVLAFTSRRGGMDTDLYVVFLSEELNEKSSADLDEYFKQAGEKVKKHEPPKDVVASGEIVLGTPPAPVAQPDEEPPAEAEGPAEAGEDEDAEREEQSIDQRLRALLKEFLEGPKEEKPAKEEEEEEAEEYEYDLESAYRRLRRVTGLPADQKSFALAPAGDLLVFSSSHEGSARLFSVKWNGQDRKRILSAGVRSLRWTPNGKRLFYLKGGKPGSCSASGGDSKTHDFRAKLAIVHRAEAEQKFDEAARMIGRRFYHPTLKGLDWPALTEKYRALALQTHTCDEFDTIFNLLLGELNGSHLGMSGPGDRSVERVGYLGCELDPGYPGPGFKIARITPRSPADRDESRLTAGDVLLRVNGVAVGPDAPLDRALIDTVDDQIIVEYLPSDGTPRPTAESDAAEGERASEELVIRPISYGSFSRLCYEDWVESNRRYVEEQSNGRVAYLHIAGMGERQFHVFERDLYAAAHGKDGLIIDVRNNGGGWTADWVMAVLSVRRHAYTVGRGGKPGYPQDRLIFYAWTKPAAMMCNQCSFSNAEIVSHAFKNLGRGPLVGTTTFGAVISTGVYHLIDGTDVRMPFRGWYTLPDEVDMENHGAVPDVQVPRGPDAEAHGLHPQLDAAIAAALAQLDTTDDAADDTGVPPDDRHEAAATPDEEGAEP